MYIDLDVSPKDKFKEIKNKPIIVGLNGKCSKHNNSVIKLESEQYIRLRQYCISQFKEKLDIKIYEQWKKRFFLQSVSASMFHRFCMKEKIPIFTDFLQYFNDEETGAWFNI